MDTVAAEQLYYILCDALSDDSGNGHISLIQAQSYFDEDATPPEDLVTHVRQCAYCTELLNGLEAAAVEESLEIALAKVKALGLPYDQAIFAMLIVGESLSDIAEVCGLSYSATGVRVHRIRNIIKELQNILIYCCKNKRSGPLFKSQ